MASPSIESASAMAAAAAEDISHSDGVNAKKGDTAEQQSQWQPSQEEKLKMKTQIDSQTGTAPIKLE